MSIDALNAQNRTRSSDATMGFIAQATGLILIILATAGGMMLFGNDLVNAIGLKKKNRHLR